MLTEPSDLS